jgi:hypothetical protein
MGAMRWKVAVGVLAICVVIGFLVWRGDSTSRRLADGSTMVVSRVRVGHSNVYTHGNFLSKTVGRFAPTNGLTIAGSTIPRPTQVKQIAWLAGTQNWEVLTAEVRLLPRSAQVDDFLKPPFYRKYRVVLIGDDGFTYVQEYQQFKQYPDGLFSYINANTFPRTSRRLHIRIDQRESSSTRDFREVAMFDVKNPKPIRPERWVVEKSPRIKVGTDVEVEVGELVVRSEPIHQSDMWEHIAILPLRFVTGGKVATNWGIHDTRVRDASGNFDYFGSLRSVTNDWVLYHGFRPLDPAQPWRFDVGFALAENFPETNLFSFEVSWPMAGTNQTNFGGLPVSICWVNTDMLAVELPGQPAAWRLTFVEARDAEGNDLNDRSGSWRQHGFWRLLKVRSSKGMKVSATVAIHPNYPATFILQPRHEKK